MTTSSPEHKNYNLRALQGADIDDMEYVDNFKLDPGVAYTPAINDAMIDMVYQQNIESGVPEHKAKQLKSEAMATVKSAMR